LGRDLTVKDLRPLLQFREQDPRILYADIALCYLGMPGSPKDPIAVLDELKALDPDGMEWFAFGLGPVFAQAFPGDVPAMLESLETYPKEWRAPFAEAIGYIGTGWRADQASFLAEARTCVHTAELEAYSRGMGARIVRIFELYPFGLELVMRPDRVGEYIRTFPEPMVNAMLVGAEEERERNRL
ncbi:MAG: hypothetical protein KDB61_05815, partial [Planctomycetes bacterium]|nr:hypothetical protein [Planctomycetota bacterium]